MNQDPRVIKLDIGKPSMAKAKFPGGGLAVLLFVLVAAPFAGMLGALINRLIWGWFLAPQYGDGPTLQSWFGISVLWGLAMYGVRRKHDEKSESDTWIMHVAGSVFDYLLSTGLALVCASLARLVWGW